MAQYYDSEDYRKGYPAGIESHFWNVARNHALARAVGVVTDKKALIMDVGCGMGISTVFLSRLGYNCRGVEMGAVNLHEQALKLVQVGKSVFDLPEQTRCDIEVVLLLDVLEHVEDRPAFLRRLRRELPNCKALIITVPARQEFWGEYDRYWGHHLRYDRPQLSGELRQAGYKSVKMSYFFHAIYVIGMCMKLLGIKRQVEFQAPGKTLLSRLLQRLLGAWGKLENRVVPGFILGSSIICYAVPGADKPA